MLNTAEFTKVYNESRNGANHMVRHPLVRNFIFSDGVHDLAQTGCYWLLDKLATEIPAVYKKVAEDAYMIILQITVKNHQADIVGTFEDDEDPVSYKAHVAMTDLPEGQWNLYIGREYDENGHQKFVCILPAEY